MSRLNSVDKKKGLTLQKEKLLEELKYYERRIADAKINQRKQIDYDESSDSDSELPFSLHIEPSIANLKIEHSSLQTCFHATQELTGLQVLQSEVNVLVEDPRFDGEPPVTEEGVWREVIVECRVDLVPFSMSFFVHQPSRRFAPLSYRGLRVAPIKKPHEVELEKSILPELTRPSDAFEVLKAYSSAHRSRRCTLAQLAGKHSSLLRMAPLAEGGYQLKCGNMLEISWTLQNRSSPVAPFHHRMKFDLEYMDEAHIQTIMQAHKALSDPTIDTDGRTALLSKIINVCLEVQGVNPLDSTASESESAPSRTDQPTKRKREDSEAMAPPKAPPKKSRPKGKENKIENRPSGKPGKRDGDMASESRTGDVESAGGTSERTGTIVKKIGTENSGKTGTGEQNVGTKSKNGSEKVKKVSNLNIKEGSDGVVKVSDAKGNERPVALLENVKNKHKGTEKKVGKSTVNKEDKKRPKGDNSGVRKISALSTQDRKKDHDRVVQKNIGQTDRINTQRQLSPVKDNPSKGKQIENESKQKPTTNFDGENTKKANKKNVETNRDNVDRLKNLTPTESGKKSDKAKRKLPSNVGEHLKKSTVVGKVNVEPKRDNRSNLDKPKSLSSVKQIRKSTDPANFKAKLLKARLSSDKRSSVVNGALQKNTRIPQKAPASVQKVIKKNPLRISPRKSVTKLSGLPKGIRKPFTHIPRLVNKPMTK